MSWDKLIESLGKFDSIDRLGKSFEWQSKIQIPSPVNGCEKTLWGVVGHLVEQTDYLIELGNGILNSTSYKAVKGSTKWRHESQIINSLNDLEIKIKKWQKRQKELQAIPEYCDLICENDGLHVKADGLHVENDELKKEITRLRQEVARANQLDSDLKAALRIIELKKLKKQTNTLTVKQLSLRPKVKRLGIEYIYEQSKHLFDNSTLEMWVNLLNDNVLPFDAPFVLSPGTSLVELAFMLDELKNRRIINNGKYKKVIEDLKCFEFNGNRVEAKQLSNAISDVKHKTSPEPSPLFDKAIFK